MLNYKILLASFALVFVAELGDKTQLTALAFSASSRSPWSVFLGTSLALVCASALAVLLGGVLAAHVPEKVVQILAAVMFVAVGVGLLVNVARRAPSETLRDSPKEYGMPLEPPTSLAYRLVIEQARHFEEDTADLFFSLAENAPSGPLRGTLERIAREEIEHSHSLSGADGVVQGTDPQALFNGSQPEGSVRPAHIPSAPTWPEAENTGRAGPDSADRECRKLLDRALVVEEGAADFYLALSRLSALPSLRRVFRHLAVEELRHADQLGELLEDSLPDADAMTT